MAKQVQQTSVKEQKREEVLKTCSVEKDVYHYVDSEKKE